MSAIVTAQALTHFLWQGALVGLAAWIALSLLERAKASTRYMVALGALLLMAALPFATAFRLAGDIPRPAPAAVSAAPAAAPIVKAPAAAGGRATVRTFGAALLPWIFNLWLAGVAALSLVHLGGFRRVRHLSRQGRPMAEALQALARDLGRRLGVRRAVALLESAAVSVPATVGWLRPVVLVPASALTGLTPRQLEAILAHELAHVRRHDYLVNLLQTAVETLLFYHPAVWWVSAQVRRERENCCDDLAVTVCGDRLGYARALVELEGLRAATPRLALAASGGSLIGRVRRLLAPPGRPSRRPWAAGLLALALLPAGAVVQTACSGTTARQALHGKEPHQTRTWSVERQGDKLRLSLEVRTVPWSKWTSMDDYPLSDLAGLSPGKDVRFELRRSAGTVRLQGDYDGRRGHGTFTFAGDPAFTKEIGGSPSDPRLLELAVYDIPLSYVQEMRELGYARPAQYRRPRNLHEMVRWHFKDLFGHGHPSSLQQLEEFHHFGVTPEFVRGIQEAGYRDISASDLVELHLHGVEPDWVQGVSASGYRRLLPFQLVELHQYGISPEWLRGMVQAGYGNAAPDQLISMRQHGIDGESIRRAGISGGRPSPEELISMQARGRLGR
ncbi:MAG TPA: M56 family metallopeptidase [Thermoanaerobaculia bacterium]|jgi:beta-lactamase regulating signal transducer with metallopeptidase domain